MLVRREIVREGRGRAWVNQTPVTLAALRALGAHLIEVHGQHEHQSLLHADAQRDLLDRLGGAETARARAAVAQAHATWRAAAEAQARFDAEERAAQENADAWRYAHEELAARRARPRRDRGAGRAPGAPAPRRTAGRAAGAGPRRARRHGRRGGRRRRGRRAPRRRRRRAAAARGRDVRSRARRPGRRLRRRRDRAVRGRARARGVRGGDDLAPAEAEAAEERHALLERLARKYRRDEGALIAWRDELAERLARLEDKDAERARLAAAEADARAALARAARALGARRTKAAAKLEAGISPELTAVGLARAALTVRLTPLPEPTALGGERVEFAFAPNAGEEPRPLARIASGGELSRVMLALRTLAVGEDGVAALLFDEVDSGIGGAVARAVGERLARLGRVRQVLCVTHLPVIACQADRQFRITKLEQGGRTRAVVERVEGEDRIGELARMLAGDAATETTRRQARELLRLPRA